MTSPAPTPKPVKVLRKQRFYPHPIDVVWAALTDAQALAQWLMPNNFVPEVGRAFEFRFDTMGPMRGITECRVLELQPPASGRAHMVWSWSAAIKQGQTPANTPDMRIEWTLEAHEGGTRLTFIHSGLELIPWMYRMMMTFGWGTMLKRWLPAVCRAFEQTPSGPVYHRLAKAPNRGQQKTRTVPDGFAK